MEDDHDGGLLGEAKGARPSTPERFEESARERLEEMMAMRRDCQRTLDLMAAQQLAFWEELRGFARSQSGPSDGGYAVMPTPPTPRPTRRSSFQKASSQDNILEPRQSILEPRHSSEKSMAASALGSEGGVGTRSRDNILASVETERIRLSTMPSNHSIGLLTGSLNFLGILRRGASASGFIGWTRAMADCLLQSNLFEPLMGCIILFNAVNIGWTIERELLREDTSTQQTIEIVLLCIFVVELLLRFFVKGWRCLASSWNLFDFVLIFITVVSFAFWPLISNLENEAAGANGLLDSLLVLRMLRLLRLVRAVRFIKICRPLWKLVHGLMQCMSTMVSAIALLALAIYLFACFGAEIITKTYREDAVVGGLVNTYFGSLPTIILTLFQFISMDSTSTIYGPLIARSPTLSLYFLLLVVTVTIMLMNLITAVVVDDAISTSQMDNDMKKHDLRRRLREVRPAFKKLFYTIDEKSNGNGIVEIQEIMQAIKTGLDIPQEISEVVSPGRILDLFDLLDQDEDGGLTESEFVDGLSCLALSSVPMETMQLMHVVRSIRRGVMLLQEQQQEAKGARGSNGSVNYELGFTEYRRIRNSPTYRQANGDDFAGGAEDQGGVLQSAFQVGRLDRAQADYFSGRGQGPADPRLQPRHGGPPHAARPESTENELTLEI